MFGIIASQIQTIMASNDVLISFNAPKMIWLVTIAIHRSDLFYVLILQEVIVIYRMKGTSE